MLGVFYTMQFSQRNACFLVIYNERQALRSHESLALNSSVVNRDKHHFQLEAGLQN